MSNDTSNHYCIILCGGVGNRLWPYSREDRPKQFLDLMGMGLSMLQLTYHRFSRIVPPQNIYISTYRDYTDMVRIQLPNIQEDHIIAEPVQRGTAPATALTLARIYQANRKASIIVSPADQMIVREDAFRQQVADALAFVEQEDRFVVMGIKPTYPETTYGYIQAGNEVDGDFARVKSFTEKPGPAYAQLFCDSGEFFWSTGLFLGNAQAFLSVFKEFHPAMAQIVHMIDNGDSDRELENYIGEQFPRTLYQSLDMLILEHCANVYVQSCSFGWADLGNWDNLFQVSQKDSQGNAVLNSRSELYNSHGNVVNVPPEKVVFAKGLDNYLISENGNILIICPKDDPALLRRMMADARLKYGNDMR